MSLQDTVNFDNEKVKHWSGGHSPFKVSYGKLMMWYFLVGDAFSFAALLITCGTLRYFSDYWPDANHVFYSFPGAGHMDLPLVFVSLMTFILIMSSVTMVRAVQEGHMMNKKGVLFWLGLTILGGIAFLSCQAWEWTHLIHGGMTFNGNLFGPDHSEGPAVYGQLFFTITGFHGFHVFSGVTINLIVFLMTWNNVFEKRGHYEMIEKVGLYWHFVDLVWVFVFLVFYLL
jgi:cytochrome c oxidase subunit 3